MPPVQAMARAIRRLRNQKGWSQEELARRANLARSYIAKLELAKADPRLSILLKLKRALGCTLDDLAK